MKSPFPPARVIMRTSRAFPCHRGSLGLALKPSSAREILIRFNPLAPANGHRPRGESTNTCGRFAQATMKSIPLHGDATCSLRWGQTRQQLQGRAATTRYRPSSQHRTRLRGDLLGTTPPSIRVAIRTLWSGNRVAHAPCHRSGGASGLGRWAESSRSRHAGPPVTMPIHNIDRVSSSRGLRAGTTATDLVLTLHRDASHESGVDSSWNSSATVSGTAARRRATIATCRRSSSSTAPSPHRRGNLPLPSS